MSEVEVCGDLYVEWVEDDLDYEGQIEVEEGCNQCGGVVGFEKGFFVYDVNEWG